MGIEQNKIEQNNFDSDEISLKELFLKITKWYSFLKSKWIHIFILGFFGGFVGLAIAWFDIPTYKATLTFAMEEDKGAGGGFSGALGLASSFGIDLGGGAGGGAFAATNLAELMKSRLIIEKVLIQPININNKTTTLVEYYIQKNNLRNKWKENLRNIHFYPNLLRTEYSLQHDSILQEIYKKLIKNDNLTIMQKDKKVTILSIEVISNDEFFSKTFCENLVNKTSEFYIETKSKKSRINVDVLQKQVDSVKSELDGSITTMAIETDNVYNLNPAYNIKGTNTKKKQIDVQANTSILTNLVVQLELAKITLRKETPLIQVIDSPIFPLERQKIGKIKATLMGCFLLMFLGSFVLILKKVITE